MEQTWQRVILQDVREDAVVDVVEDAVEHQEWGLVRVPDMDRVGNHLGGRITAPVRCTICLSPSGNCYPSLVWNGT